MNSIIYTIKRLDLKNKLSVEDSLIQAGLDSGWSSFLKSGQSDLEKLTDSEKDYLFKSAISYFVAGDLVIKYRAEYYSQEIE